MVHAQHQGQRHHLLEPFRLFVEPEIWYTDTRQPLGLATLRCTSTVDYYTENFLALVPRVGDLQEPLKTEVELNKPIDMEEAMSRARRLPVPTSARLKSRQSTGPWYLNSLVPLHMLNLLLLPRQAPQLLRASSRVVLRQRPRPQGPSSASLLRRWLNVSFNCLSQFSRGHKCKNLFFIEMLPDLIDVDNDDDNSLMGLQGFEGRTHLRHRAPLPHRPRHRQ